MGSKGVEKRRFQRLDVPLTVTVSVLTSEETLQNLQPVQVQSLNISLEGICLESRHILFGTVNVLSGSPGAREHVLCMDIVLEPGGAALRLTGEVCWYDVTYDAGDFRYQIGVVFRDVDPESTTQLRAFLKAHKKPGGLLRSLFGRATT